jgi:hypothetical protein
MLSEILSALVGEAVAPSTDRARMLCCLVVGAGALGVETWLSTGGAHPLQGTESAFNAFVSVLLFAIASGVVSAAHIVTRDSSRLIASAALVVSAAAVIWPLVTLT